jgi:hypothetical protein
MPGAGVTQGAEGPHGLAKMLCSVLLRMINLKSLRKLGCHFGGIKRPDSVPLLDLQC